MQLVIIVIIIRQVQFAPDTGAYAACCLSLVLVVHRPFALLFAFGHFHCKLQRATAIAIAITVN